MGVGFQTGVSVMNADQLQQLKGFCRSRAPIQTKVNGQHFANLLFHRMQRVQGGHGLLKDHADLVTTNLAHLCPAEIQ